MQPEDKESLVENMKKIIRSVSSNRIQQAKVFESLTKEDITKLFGNFQNPDPTIRKVSARLVCELMFDNNLLREKLSSTLLIHPVSGNIILNVIPGWLRQTPHKLLDIMKFLKQDTFDQGSRHLCWYIDPQLPVISVQYVNLNSYQINDFIDPTLYIFGISYEERTQGQKDCVLNSEPSAISKYYLRSNGVQKQRLTFSSRQKGNTTLQQMEYLPTQKIGELSFRTDRYPNRADKPGISNPITDRHPINMYSTGKSKESELTKSKHRQGIQVTTPTNMAAKKEREDKSQERYIIVLGGKTHPNLTSASSNKPYTFGTKSTTLSSYLNGNLCTPSPKIQFSRMVPQPKQRQQGEIKISNNYRPSDEFIRKIKEGSTKTRH